MKIFLCAHLITVFIVMFYDKDKKMKSLVREYTDINHNKY